MRVKDRLMRIEQLAQPLPKARLAGQADAVAPSIRAAYLDRVVGLRVHRRAPRPSQDQPAANKLAALERAAQLAALECAAPVGVFGACGGLCRCWFAPLLCWVAGDFAAGLCAIETNTKAR